MTWLPVTPINELSPVAGQLPWLRGHQPTKRSDSWREQPFASTNRSWRNAHFASGIRRCQGKPSGFGLALWVRRLGYRTLADLSFLIQRLRNGVSRIFRIAYRPSTILPTVK